MMRLSIIFLLMCTLPVVAESPTPDVGEVVEAPASLSAAQKDAVKRVLLARAVQIKVNRHRITPEAAAANVALAKQLGAPDEFVGALIREMGHPLAGRAAYDHRQQMEEMTQEYEIDALQIRLFVEGLQVEPGKIAEVIDWLPVRDLFNLATLEQLKLLRGDTLPGKLTELQALYEKMLEVYNTINSRETADAAAQTLLSCLPELDRTASIRMLLRRMGSHRLPGYDEIVGDIARRLSSRRRELFESSFYASVHMEALDALLCF